MTISELITAEEVKIQNSLSPTEKLGILFNLLELKNKTGLNGTNYLIYKQFIDCYVEVVKKGNFGYDKFNQSKIETALGYLTIEERVSACRYSVSVITRELPEYDRGWLIEKMNSSQIKEILYCKQRKLYLKAIALHLANSFPILIASLVLFVLVVYLLLLPAYFPSCAIFQVTYEKYSESFFLNHFLNVLTLFGDFDTDLKVKPTNWLGVVIMLACKLIFILLIVNFFYRKITDKIKFY